jgi:D-3-phosphoglycerate dehydrogenase / 2-oxoglutarate reductase
MSKPLVLVTDGIHPSAVEILKETCEVVFEPKLDAEGLKEWLPKLSGLMVRSASQVTAECFELAPHLKMVARAGVGTDNIDLAAATRHGVIVVNSPSGNTNAAAEHTIAMMFALARHIPEADRIVKQGGWKVKGLTGVELTGKTLGVVGFGKIGRKVATVFQRLGMSILVFDPFLSKHMAEELKVESVSLEKLYAEADFLTLHAPKTPETENLLNAQAFLKMKPSVRIVNCARGGIINEADLIAAIKAGQIAGAALDVYTQEPLSADNPLLALGDKIITTPHLGASTEEAQINVAIDVAEQLVEFFKIGTAESAVNIPALRRELIEPVRPFLMMAEQLGHVVRQLAEGGLNHIELIAGGTLSKENLLPLKLAVLKGILGQGREGVNYVNAEYIAEEEGITVSESRSPKAGYYLNTLQLKLTTDTGVVAVTGTVLSEQLYRIVDVNGYPANIEPSRYLLFTPHTDKPGMIAQIATILGAHEINVSSLQVARKGTAAGGASMMVFNLDQGLPSGVLSELTRIDGIHSSRFVQLYS